MIADVVIVVGIFLSAYIGCKRGFIKSVSKLCCWIVAVLVAKILNPFVSEFMRQSFVGKAISEKVNETSHAVIPEDLPLFLKQAGENTANGLSDVAIGACSVLIIVVITFLVANFLVGALGFVSKAPVISSVNKALGCVFGLATGVLIVYLVLAVMFLCNVQQTQSWFEQSVIAYTMYRHNIFMNLIF